ncbi:MAG: Preprotein translocase subunit SecG [Myxococcaceae bacterium]|nr:Preprotein translocase subunit SecG [Myxococcaceae bacterium]
MNTWIETLLKVVHIFVCAVLMFVVLLQQGKGGGMGAAFGAGGGAAQVFGGRGAGNILTKATTVCAAIFMLTSVSLAYISSSGDRAMKAKLALEEKKMKDKGTARPKDETKPEGIEKLDKDKVPAVPMDTPSPIPVPPTPGTTTAVPTTGSTAP